MFARVIHTSTIIFLLWNVDGVRPGSYVYTTEDVDGPSNDENEIQCSFNDFLFDFYVVQHA